MRDIINYLPEASSRPSLFVAPGMAVGGGAWQDSIFRGLVLVRGRSTNLSVQISAEERNTLVSWQQSEAVHDRLARRGRIILMLADNASVSHTARTVGIQRRFVYKWAQRFLDSGLAGLFDRHNNSATKLCSELPGDPGPGSPATE